MFVVRESLDCYLSPFRLRDSAYVPGPSIFFFLAVGIVIIHGRFKKKKRKKHRADATAFLMRPGLLTLCSTSAFRVLEDGRRLSWAVPATQLMHLLLRQRARGVKASVDADALLSCGVAQLLVGGHDDRLHGVGEAKDDLVAQ